MASKDRLRDLTDEIGHLYMGHIVGRVVDGQSPIEGLIMAALIVRRLRDESIVDRVPGGPYRRERDDLLMANFGIDQAHEVFEFGMWDVFLEEPIGKYRADFAFIGGGCPYGDPRAPDLHKVAVECDGHDFHEKTKEQAAHDKKRDRFFQQEGWSLLRFTGSEIYKDPHACVDEIVKMLKTLERRT